MDEKNNRNENPDNGYESSNGGDAYSYSDGHYYRKVYTDDSTDRHDSDRSSYQDFQNGTSGAYNQEFQNSGRRQGFQNGPSGRYDYQYSNNFSGEPQKSNAGFAVASLVLGIISLVLMCGPNLITGVLGIIFGAIYLSRGERERRTMAVAGLVLSIIGIALIVVLIAVIALRASNIASLYSSYGFY